MARRNRLDVDVIIDDKGTMKKSAKGAHSVDRRLKGAANASSNTSKNFSKMAQGITGGLVPAYATLAASLFALDAVYRGLTEAANLRILQEGQLAFASATGTPMLGTSTGVALTIAESSGFTISCPDIMLDGPALDKGGSFLTHTIPFRAFAASTTANIISITIA